MSAEDKPRQGGSDLRSTRRNRREAALSRRIGRRLTKATPDLAPADVPEGVIRVAIMMVDEHELLAASIGMVLNVETTLQVVAVETDPATGPIRILAAGPEVVVVDKVSLAEELRGGAPDIRVIVLGRDTDPGVVLSCIRAGAAACVNGNISPSALTDMVKRVYLGEVVYEPGVLMALIETPHQFSAQAPRKTASLSNRELDVLNALVTGARSADAAWQLGISLNTLRTHLKNVQVKLQARSKLEAVLIAIREGRIEFPQESP
jgi:DNA-binding NarL/FixJ family response regulator